MTLTDKISHAAERKAFETLLDNLLIISLFLTENRAAEPFLDCAVFYPYFRFTRRPTRVYLKTPNVTGSKEFLC